MKKFLCAFAFAVILSGSAFGASESEMKRMSVFVSNFIKIRERIHLALAMGRKCAKLLYFFPFPS